MDVNADVAGEIEICRAASHELARIGELVAGVIRPLEYYSEAARRAEIAKYSAEGLQTAITEEPDSVLIAKIDGVIVGFCISRYDDGLIWLSWFGTVPSCRRRGVVQALVAALEHSLKGRGAHKVWCDCRTTNEAARRLLTKLGFTPITTVVNHWYGHDYILWEKVSA
jgi:ribosomal protein S18 acetylase RimI-like enzyme